MICHFCMCYVGKICFFLVFFCSIEVASGMAFGDGAVGRGRRGICRNRHLSGLHVRFGFGLWVDHGRGCFVVFRGKTCCVFVGRLSSAPVGRSKLRCLVRRQCNVRFVETCLL